MTPQEAQEARMRAERHAAYKSLVLWVACVTALVYAVRYITDAGVF